MVKFGGKETTINNTKKICRYLFFSRKRIRQRINIEGTETEKKSGAQESRMVQSRENLGEKLHMLGTNWTRKRNTKMENREGSEKKFL